jgi:UDP-N-acetylmuramoyl-L-alanyl-D-glutamate--2,6-diaminopimelate ligase
LRLYEICPEAKNIPDRVITGITDDTRNYKEGNIFVCIKGKNFDGHSAAEKMLKSGASAIVVEKDLGLSNQIIVADTRKHLSLLAKRFYGDPTKGLKLIAITGTNGKSTTAAFIQFILNNLGYKCGSIGTVCYDVCGKIYESMLTTPHPIDLYRYFREMVDNGARYCVVEASSQALAQSRFSDEVLECAVFTNLTQDHLDYHSGIEDYYNSKRLLFNMAKSAVVCIDDKYGKKLVKYISGELKIPISTYSTEDAADYFAINIKSHNSEISYWLNSAQFEKSFPIKLKLPGRFNAANSIAAIAAVSVLGKNINNAVEAVQRCEGVPGRSEIIYTGKFTVMRDYAHTPDALLKFLTGIKSFVKGRILCLFGAAGERDAAKRPAMGETAAKLADYLVITSDNPRFEDEQKIINEVLYGVQKYITQYETYTDRYSAIKAILSKAEENDIVVLCGKGHETYQVIGNEYRPFDEKKIVNEILANDR